MTFSYPWALFLFVLIPAFLFISRGQLTYLSRPRRYTIIGLRLLLLSLLILALAGTQITRRSNQLSVIFLVDQSDSIDANSRENALNFIQGALRNMPADDQAGVVVFGTNALVEESTKSRLQLTEFSSTPSTGYTNFADAIRLGMAIFPPESAKRLVLISDGKNNLGEAKTAAQLAAASEIELSTLELSSTTGPEVRLESLRAPNTLRENERFDLEIGIESNITTQAEVQIFADGRLLTQEPVNLAPGEQTFTFPLVAGSQGFSTFQARLVPAQDTQGQNNRLDTFSLIEGPLQVLVVARNSDEVSNLVPALEAASLQPQVIDPSQMPSSALEISRYAAIILVNLPAFALSPAQLELLEVYVRDLGGGLLAIGGPESYGAGGYFQTPLEATLPVDMALKDKERLPGMSMFMVIDKSGSMDDAGTVGGGPRKVELAKEAINRSVDLLTPLDRVGVIAFDSAAKWVVRPVPVVDLIAIKNQVGTIRADGGTDILAGLQAAADDILQETSRVRHIVLLTDGGANPQGIPELVEDLVANEVSVSVVAIGENYAPFLEEVALAGNGRFHFARDASTIPQIFAQEAALAVRAYIVEEEFTPALAGSSQILAGISSVPNLYGHIATSPKATANTVLVSERGDPILAQWQYGLGRAVAWTSDARGQWARDWVNWDEFARFWGQAVRWTIVEGSKGGLEAQIQFDQATGNTRLIVEALDNQGNYVNDLDLVGSLVSPELEQEDLGLVQVAPGLYEADIRPDETGAYLLRVLGTGPDGQITSAATRGFVVSYSPEYAADNPNPILMTELAQLGGGRTLSLNRPEAVFDHNLPAATAAIPLWPTLLTLFVFLLPLDVGIRRITFGRAELIKLFNRLQGRLPQRPDPRPVPHTNTSSASSLLSIKQTPEKQPLASVESSQSQPEANPAITSPSPPADPSPPAKPQVIINRPIEAQTDSKDTVSERNTDNEEEEDNTMSRLLQAKRKARK